MGGFYFKLPDGVRIKNHNNLKIDKIIQKYQKKKDFYKYLKKQDDEMLQEEYVKGDAKNKMKRSKSPECKRIYP